MEEAHLCKQHLVRGVINYPGSSSKFSGPCWRAERRRGYSKPGVQDFKALPKEVTHCWLSDHHQIKDCVLQYMPEFKNLCQWWLNSLTVQYVGFKVDYRLLQYLAYVAAYGIESVDSGCGITLTFSWESRKLSQNTIHPTFFISPSPSSLSTPFLNWERGVIDCFFAPLFCFQECLQCFSGILPCWLWFGIKGTASSVPHADPKGD